MTDPFESLARPTERQEPRPGFARQLRAQLLAELGLDPHDPLPTIDLPDRRTTMTTESSTAPAMSDAPGARGGAIWAVAFYEDALAGIGFLVDVLGFDERLVVLDDDQRTVAHSELRWPEGGIVQVGTYDAANEFSRNLPPGSQSLYLVTADPHGVWARCQAAGVEVVRPPESPHYDPGGMGFTIRDPEGNLWSVGSYGLGFA